MKYIALSFLVLMIGCNTARIPKAQLSQYELNHIYKFENDSLKVFLKNTLHCPVRIWIQPQDKELKTYFDQINPILLGSLTDSIITVETNTAEKEIYFASRLGDPNRILTVKEVKLPFPKNREYRFIQGYNSNPTHNTDWSKYALDFGLAIGDTVCSATSGHVVGVIEDYKYGGPEEKWKNYGNFITIYDPSTGLYTQYVHLNYKGSFVKVGDRVESGQKIGIVGMTGQTNIPHLHLNCLQPIDSEQGLISIPLDRIGGYRISDLKRNDLVKNKN